MFITDRYKNISRLNISRQILLRGYVFLTALIASFSLFAQGNAPQTETKAEHTAMQKISARQFVFTVGDKGTYGIRIFFPSGNHFKDLQDNDKRRKQLHLEILRGLEGQITVYDLDKQKLIRTITMPQEKHVLGSTSLMDEELFGESFIGGIRITHTGMYMIRSEITSHFADINEYTLFFEQVKFIK